MQHQAAATQPLVCTQEVLVRHSFATRFREFPGIGGSPLGPALIRMVFHDASTGTTPSMALAPSNLEK